MNRITVVHPDSGILLLDNKEKQTIDMCCNIDESQNNYAEGKKPDKQSTYNMGSLR